MKQRCEPSKLEALQKTLKEVEYEEIAYDKDFVASVMGWEGIIGTPKPAPPQQTESQGLSAGQMITRPADSITHNGSIACSRSLMYCNTMHKTFRYCPEVLLFLGLLPLLLSRAGLSNLQFRNRMAHANSLECKTICRK